MTGHKSFAVVRDRMTPERLEGIERKAETLRRETALGELREARRLTQAALGETLRVGERPAG